MKIFGKLLSVLGVLIGLVYLAQKGLTVFYNRAFGHYTVFDDEKENIVQPATSKEE